MPHAIQRLTADDAFRLQHEAGVYGYELVDGALVEMTPGGWPHGRTVLQVGRKLGDFVDEHGDGNLVVDAGFVFRVPGDTERLRYPDLAYVSRATLEAAGGEPETLGRFAPDLAVEIDSPSNVDEDVQQKVQDYLAGGARLVWRIHPKNRSATVYHPDGSARLLGEDDVLDGEDVLPGFRTTVKSLLG